MICEYCGKKVRGKGVRHVNIGEGFTVRHFCKKACRDDWCADSQLGNLKSLIEWSIGYFNGSYFFVQNVRSIVHFLKDASFFSPSLGTLDLGLPEFSVITKKVKTKQLIG